MSRFFDDLEAQLQAAAVARTTDRAASRRSFPRLRRGARLLPVLAAALVAVAIAALVLTRIGSGGAHGGASAGGHPAPPNHPLPLAKLEATYINQATRAMIRRDPACARADGLLPPESRVSTGRPSGTLLSILGLLRRPPTAADKPPRDVIDLGLGTIYIHYVRLARIDAGVRYYLVVTQLPGSPPPPRRCAAELRSTLKRELPQALSTSERNRILALAEQALAQGPDLPRRPYDTVFLVGSGAIGGSSATQLAKMGLVGASGWTIYGLVPDGVATVALPLRPLHGYPKTRLIATVVNNVFVAKAPRFDLPTGEVWLSPSGAVIKRVNLDQ